MATRVQPFSASHSASSSRPAVVVPKVRTSRATLPPATRRTAATTVASWTSRPAQRGLRTSMAPSSRRAAGVGPPSGKSGRRAPGRRARRGTSGGARRVPGPTRKRARAHQGEGRPRCRRRGATLPRFHPRRVGRPPVGNYKDFRAFPDSVQDAMGYALYWAQTGDLHHSAKPLKGFGGASVIEIVEDCSTDTYRAIYTVRFSGIVYVLHAFQKKRVPG